jgi:hypothetical protein
MIITRLVLITLLTFVIVSGLSGHVLAAGCSMAGGTGLTTAMVASPNQVISGVVDAAGCDLGIYVGPGAAGVVIANATVTGANDHGILVQDTTDTIIEESLITLNGINPHSICPFGNYVSTPAKPCVANDYEIVLVGTSHAMVRGNTVSFNPTDGGIAAVDDGAVDPAAPNPGTPHQSVSNVITNNLIENIEPGCGILVASYNSGASAGAVDNTVTENLVLGSTPEVGLYNGQIVVAANANSTVISGTMISNNIVDGSVLPGVAVHANFPGDVISHTTIQNNIISNNGYYPPAFASPNSPVAANGTVGISLVAEAYPGMSTPPTVSSTSIISNAVQNDKYALWTCKAADTNIVDMRGNASIPMVDCQSSAVPPSSTTSMVSAISSLPTYTTQSQFSSGLILLVTIVIILLVGVAVWRRSGGKPEA